MEPERQYETFNRLKVIRDRLDAVVQRAQEEWDLTPPPEPVTDADDLGESGETEGEPSLLLTSA